MSSVLQSGLKTYDFATDSTASFVQGMNDNSVITDDFIRNKITLNGEAGQSNFNFIENKVVQDGLVKLIFNPITIYNTGIVVDKNSEFTMIMRVDISKPYDNTSVGRYIGGNLKSGDIGWYAGYHAWVSSDTISIHSSGNQTRSISGLYKGLHNISITLKNGILTMTVGGQSVTTLYTADSNYPITLGGYGYAGGYNGLVCNFNMLYNRVLTPQEIQHNFSVLNNTPSLSALEVTNSANETSILSLGSTGNHVEMSSGRTLEEEYMGVLDGMSQEYTSTGSAITVNDGLKARLVGAEIQGNTWKNLIVKSNFSDGISDGWGSLAGHTKYIRDDPTCYGGKYLLHASGNATYQAISYNLNEIITGNKYYYLARIKNSKQDGKCMLFYGGAINSSEYDCNDWTIASMMFTGASAVKDVRIGSRGTGGDVMIDYALLVNLSSIFGSGKEPTKEWCDVNIKYFNGLSSTEATITNNGIKYPFYQQYVEGETVVQKRAKGSSNEWVTIPQDETRDTVANEYRLYSASDWLGSVSGVVDKVDLASKEKREYTKEVVLDGTEEVTHFANNSTGNTAVFLIKLEQDMEADMYKHITTCNSFKTFVGNIWTVDIRKDAECCNCNIFSILKTKASTVEQFKQYLAQQKANGTPVTIRYKLATPVITQLTDEQLATYSPYKKQILLGGVDGVNDKLTLNSDGSLSVYASYHKMVLTGSENYAYGMPTNDGLHRVCTINVPFGAKPKTYGICNMFPYINENTYANITKECIVSHPDYSSYIGISIKISNLQSNTDASIKSYVKNLYDSGKPIEVIYPLATPIVTTIPKEVNAPVLTNQSNVLSAGEAVSASSFVVKLPTTSTIKKQYAQTLLNNYTGTASVNLLKDGRVQIDMTVTIPTTFNQTVFSLPTELRPKVDRKVMGFNGNTPITLLVGTDGTVKIPTTITGVVELCDEYTI